MTKNCHKPLEGSFNKHWLVGIKSLKAMLININKNL